MAISIQPVLNLSATTPTSSVTPATTLISQLAQTDLANQPDTEVIVTLGDGEPAILVYDAHGILQEVLFDLAPPPSAVQTAGEELSTLAQTAAQTALAQETGIAAATATPETSALLFNPTVNLTQAQSANDLLFALAEANTTATTPEITATVETATTNTLLTENAAIVQTTIAQGVIAATTANIPNPTLTSVEAANQDFINALAAAATNTTANNALTNADFNTLLTALEAQTVAATPPVTPLTATTAAADIAAAEAATLNVTPAPVQNPIAAAAQALTPTTAAPETVQAFATIPTTDTTNNLLQNLLTQAANQALSTISSNPSYANSLAALLLSSTGARVRMVDETGALLTTPEPVGPILAITPTRAVS